MKKIFGLILISSLVLMFGCSSGDNSNEDASNESASEPLNLKISSIIGTQDQHSEYNTMAWMEQVEEESDLTFDAFWSGELVPMGEEIRALKDGTTDIAVMLPPYNTKQFPLSDVVLLPLKESSGLIAANAWADLLYSDVEIADGNTFNEIEYEHHGIHAIPSTTNLPYTIGVTDHEFTDAESLQNLQLRTSGQAHEIFIQELGSSPVSMPVSEEFEALNRGTVDGTVKSVGDILPNGLETLLSQALTGVNIGHFPIVTAIEEEKWNNLPDDVQTSMKEAADKLSYEDTSKDDDFDKALDTMEEEGVELVDYSELEPDAQDWLDQAYVNTWEKWIELKEEQGHPGKEVAKLWRDLIIENGGSVPDAIMEIE